MKSKENNDWTLITILIVMSLIGSFLVSGMDSFFGIYIPKSMAEGINGQLGFLLFILALTLFFGRKKMERGELARTLLMTLAVALLIVGWRFSAGPPDWSGNDGFTVTGGFMMLFSGLIAGSILTYKRLNK